MHCYQSSYDNDGVEFSTLNLFLNKLSEFVEVSSKSNGKVKAHINFTGGEPFLKKDFLKLIKTTSDKKIFSFGILSNGFLPSNAEIEELKSYHPKFVQISLEGNKALNDQIRGEGSFDQVVTAIKTYNRLKIPVMLSFTATSLNYKYFPDVVKIARKYNVYKVWTDRYLPNSKNDFLMLAEEQSREYFNILQSEKQKSKYHIFSKTIVSSERALQFLNCGGIPYKCSAGENLLAILPNGDILPCRRMPVKVGNLVEEDLTEIYTNNEFLISLRDNSILNNSCRKCFYSESCKGGLKCLSFALSGNFNGKDTDCWI
jgi:radical SAM protein with 4Fe4S-binding SPASM domain